MSTADEVLLNAIMTRHGYTRAEAEEAARYVEKLWAVRWLLESEQIVHKVGASFATCRGCGRIQGRKHHPDCMAMAAKEALALTRQEAADTDAPVPPPRHETSHPPR